MIDLMQLLNKIDKNEKRVYENKDGVLLKVTE